MPRTAEALEGLAVLGRAQAGPLELAVPCLLMPEHVAAPVGAPWVRYAPRPAPSGRRGYELGPAAAPWRLELRVPTPDLEAPADVQLQRDGSAAFVRGPIGPRDAAELAREPPELVVLTNARTLFAEGEPFVNAVATIRRSAGARPLLWTPRVATPNRVPFLVYASVDLLDPVAALVDAAEGRWTDPELGFVGAGAIGFDAPAAGRTSQPEDAAGRAVALLARELERARAAAREGRLRELVEARLTSEPLLAELLRYADHGWARLLEERAPVTETTSRTYVLRESFRRPSVARFRQRFRERYHPPGSKRLLLLVPCSKTKPYRNSPSHRRIAKALEGVPGLERIHTVSVTSPLGVVPRELEDLPPARHYDIPVTGDWDEAEREAVRTGVRTLLERGRYEAVVAHLDPAEYGFLQGALEPGPPVRWTLPDDRTTSTAALQSLRATVDELTGSWGPSQGAMRTVREELKALAEMQFGSVGAEALFRDPVRLHGRPWFQRLSDGAGSDLATWREERGLFQLTVPGGERIGARAGLSVELAAGVTLKGDLFSPGVARADDGIRVGDAVLLCRNDEVQAVGEARLPGPMMAQLGRGLAVEVRHRRGAAPSADRALEGSELAGMGRSSSG